MQITIRVEVDANVPSTTDKRNTVTVECGSVVVVVDAPTEEPINTILPATNEKPAQPPEATPTKETLASNTEKEEDEEDKD